MKFLTKIQDLDNTLSSKQKDNDAQLDGQIKKNKAHHKQMTKIQNDPLTFVALQNELASIINHLAIDIDKDQTEREMITLQECLERNLLKVDISKFEITDSYDTTFDCIYAMLTALRRCMDLLLKGQIRSDPSLAAVKKIQDYIKQLNAINWSYGIRPFGADVSSLDLLSDFNAMAPNIQMQDPNAFESQYVYLDTLMVDVNNMVAYDYNSRNA